MDECRDTHTPVPFGNDTSELVIQRLVQDLVTADPRRAPAASEALRLISNESVVRTLVEAATEGSDWVLATLGGLSPTLVRPAVEGSELMSRLRPMLLVSEGANWLANEQHIMDITFLSKQNL